MNEGKLIWVTKDGTEIATTDMTDQHLENAIHSFACRGKPVPYVLQVEAERRGWDTWVLFGEAEFLNGLSYYDDLRKL